MKVRVEEMRSQTIEVKAEVPRAMAQAFRDANLGMMEQPGLKTPEQK